MIDRGRLGGRELVPLYGNVGVQRPQLTVYKK